MENATDFENLGQLIDELDNLTHALNLRMPDAFHVLQLKSELPKLVEKFKMEFEQVSGENPWVSESRFLLDDEESPF